MFVFIWWASFGCVRRWRDTAVYLFDQFDGRLQVHAEVNKRPRNALTFVFLLLQYKHVVVKVLLQTFIREVYAQLVETIELRRQVLSAGFPYLCKETKVPHTFITHNINELNIEKTHESIANR